MHLDHIVHFVTAPPETMKTEADSAGFKSVLGGKHAQWGTANTLSFLASSYIEWLSLVELSVAEKADHPLTQLLLHDRPSGPGFGTICLRPESIEHVWKKFREKGIATTEVLDASRETPAGDVLRWKMLFVLEEPTDQLPLPFFIEWEQTQVEKYKDLNAEGQLPEHVEKLQVKQLVLATEDPKATARKWSELFDVKAEGNEVILNNTRLHFVSSEGGPCRLQRVDIAGTGTHNTIEIEGGTYTFLP